MTDIVERLRGRKASWLEAIPVMEEAADEIERLRAEIKCDLASIPRRTIWPYPIILNGDHAEFEMEHANTPPKERPDWPLPSFDSRDWAEAFCKIANEHGFKDAKGEPVDECWMISWFANALMRGFDEATARNQSRG